MPEFNAGVEFEPSGYFRKRDWFNNTHNLLIITGKREKPSIKKVYQDALQWMVKLARLTTACPEADAPEPYRQRANGIAAYDAWAAQLLQDQDFPAGQEAVLRQRYQVHNDAVGTVAEARWYGSQFLVGMSEGADNTIHRDAIEDLYHAAALYAGDHSLMWQLWDLVGGIYNPDAWKQFADPGVRRRMIPIIQQARDKDARAAEHLAHALTFQQ